MPCSCFGKKDCGPKRLPTDVPYGKGYVKPADEGDFVKNNRSGGGAYLAAGQKSDTYVNGSSVASKSNTPSTVAVVDDGSPQGSLSGGSLSGGSPAGSYRGALLRSELAQKRREFFRDYFVVEDEVRHLGGGGSRSSATLPAAGSRRVRHFEEDPQRQPLRPASQPSSVAPSPLPPAAAPPGPHLLRPTGPQPAKLTQQTFASPVFLRELRDASQEISLRWQMPDAERDATPCSLKGKVRVFPVSTYATEGAVDPLRSDPFPAVDANMVQEEFPELHFTPHGHCDSGQPLLNVRAESPEIDIIITQSQYIVDMEAANSPDLSSAGSPDIRTESPDNNAGFPDITGYTDGVIVKEEYITVTQRTTDMPLDEQLVVGSVPTAACDSALNFPPAERDHQTPSPTAPSDDGPPRIVELLPATDTPTSASHPVDILATTSPPVESRQQSRSHIPLRQELGRAASPADRAVQQPAAGDDDKEVNVSFSSDEIPDDIPHKAWQEDEVRPLLDEDDGPTTPSISHDTSPHLINN